jgi:chromosome segregation ATPase
MCHPLPDNHTLAHTHSAQEAKRAELEALSQQLTGEQNALQEALGVLQDQEQQQASAAADLAKREAALEGRAAALGRDQAALMAAQAAALRQIDSLESSLRSKLDSHQQQVGGLVGCC